MIDPRSLPLVILGSGYTGKFLYPLAKTSGWRTYATSRTPSTHLQHVATEDRLYFDLQKKDSWRTIPEDAHFIWCFPALPQQLAADFLESRVSESGRLIVLGSTSAYGNGANSPIDETAPLDYSLPRVESEEYLRKSYGAIVLRLAGLYGPGRHVLNWIRRGKVKHTNRYVNLIHIEDVAAICLLAIEKGIAGECYIVSDGRPRQWSEIFSEASTRWNMSYPPPSQPKNLGKRLNIRKITMTLQHSLKYPDLYTALDEIERQNPKSNTHSTFVHYQISDQFSSDKNPVSYRKVRRRLNKNTKLFSAWATIPGHKLPVLS